MSTRSATAFVWWSAITIFLGAFLLFQVQPVISKMILPWFGGGPAVWTTCLLFFQMLLLAGYAYADGLMRLRSSRWQVGVHIAVMVAAVCTLPITPDAAWQPVDSAHPTGRILALLGVSVGLPYFALAATSPLVQVWFGRVLPWRSPYRLYALSNIGSLGALLTYPFLVEPAMTSSSQGTAWSILFGVFAVCCGGLAIAACRAAGQQPVSPELASLGAQAADFAAGKVTWYRRLLWLLLPALASVMLMAVTNHVCQDVAVVPFLWVVPLGLYLLSFIICFDREIWYRRGIFSALAGLAVLGLCVLLLEDDLEGLLTRYGFSVALFEFMDSLLVEAGVYLTVLFLVCMVCHGELVRLKPPARQLTEFYLMVAAGGTLGGILVALVCPQIFPSYVEMHIGLVAAFMLALGVFWDALWQTWLLRRLWSKCLVFALSFLLLLIVVRGQFVAVQSTAKLQLRNFYGVLSLKEYHADDPEEHVRELLNGRILHGSQFVDALKSRIPTTYYVDSSGLGLTMLNYHSDEPLRVGVVGLGTGTIAAYGGRSDFFCFYEINPNVREIALHRFSYLTESNADCKIVLGDARLSLERQPQQQYDIIALDAFSGDAIPVHLLTTEAFELYLRHLRPQGVIAVHISNRHLDLKPIVGEIAKHFRIPAVLVESSEDDFADGASADWVLVTRNQDFLNEEAIQSACEDVEGTYTPLPRWTDQYSNLFQILD